MALANKFRGWLVLICGNKSELAVGYTTIYGVDMAGGFAVIKDVFKTKVYELARARNELGRPRPHPGVGAGQAAVCRARTRSARRPEPAALRVARPDPRGVRRARPAPAAELIDAGFDPVLVHRVTRLVDVAEWKRRQAPIGVRVTPKAFGKDRRLPITNKYAG